MVAPCSIATKNVPPGSGVACTHKCFFIFHFFFFWVNKPRKIMFSTLQPVVAGKAVQTNVSHCWKANPKEQKGQWKANMKAGPAWSAISHGRNAGGRLKGKPKTKSFSRVFHIFYAAPRGFLLFIFRIFFFAGQLSCSNLFVVGPSAKRGPQAICKPSNFLCCTPFKSLNSTFNFLMILVGIYGVTVRAA